MALTETTRVRLTPDQRQKLDVIYEKLGRSNSDVIRTALDATLDELFSQNRALIEALIAVRERELEELRAMLRSL